MRTEDTLAILNPCAFFFFFLVKKLFFSFYYNKIHQVTNYTAIKNKINKTRQHRTNKRKQNKTKKRKKENKMKLHATRTPPFHFEQSINQSYDR